jgi:hypothetical protein
MTVILDQFLQSLRDRGLMTAPEVDSFLGTLPLEEKPKTSEELAKALVRRASQVSPPAPLRETLPAHLRRKMVCPDSAV